MSKITKSLLIALLATSLPIALASCIKDEPLNAECDIERVTLHLDNPEQVFFQLSDTLRDVLYTDSVINYTVRAHADLTALAPEFLLTPGATVIPASGSVQDFSQGPILYTVTSQDGQWHRRYRISFTPMSVTVSDTLKFDFEQYELEPSKNSFYIWRNTSGMQSLGEYWASGNAGFKISKGNAKPDEYPTIPMADGFEGSALRLITRDTGWLGEMAGKPIASGNLFIGSFDAAPATTDALRCTRFGMPFNLRPAKLTGYYKYKSGPVYKIKKTEVPGRKDLGSIYAVFYRNHDAQGNPVVLMGDDVQTNPNIVALARISSVEDINQWTYFEIVFDYTQDIDMTILDELGYSLTIVFASSYKGDLFEGSIGSELCIDKVRLICTREE